MTTARTKWKIGDVLECLPRELVVHSREAHEQWSFAGGAQGRMAAKTMQADEGQSKWC